VRFSIDEWMNTLYWMDCPAKNDLPWALDRVGRCEKQIAAVAEQLARVGTDAVLDLGFTQREQRDEWLQRARNAGLDIELHVLDVSKDVRWQRVCERNKGASATYSFDVTREMFDFMEGRWELPDGEELATYDQPIDGQN
jgi:predicted kinase